MAKATDRTKDIAIQIWRERFGSETPDAKIIEYAAYMFSLGVEVGYIGGKDAGNNE